MRWWPNPGLYWKAVFSLCICDDVLIGYDSCFCHCGTCSESNLNSTQAWSVLDGSSSVVDVTSSVAAVVASKPSSSQFTVYSQAFDAATNVDAIQSLHWFVDTVPPLRPTIVSEPSPIMLSPLAVFEFQLTDDTSPGQLTFVYTLTVNNQPFVAAGGNPPIPAPSPNDAIVKLTLSGLTVGDTYTISVWSVDQAGHVSVQASVFSWSIINSAPAVTVLSHPDATSGSKFPQFRFAAKWASNFGVQSNSSDGSIAEVSYQVLLLGDSFLGAWHEPEQCVDGGNGTAQRDCVMAGCNDVECTYNVELTTARAYTLQVRRWVYCWTYCQEAF